MAGGKSKSARGSKPKAANQKKPVSASPRAQTVNAVDKIISTAKSAKKSKKVKFSKAELEIMSELTHLADYIHKAKAEIGLICPQDVKNDFLPSAKDELDAVVEAAAVATHAIMDACEIVENVMGDVSAETSGKLMDATTKIYEACTFQDITGQRINKVVNTMHHIEHRIDALMETFGDEAYLAKQADRSPSAPAKTTDETEADGKISDEELLEGPQLGSKAKNQSEIDDLLASFD